MSSAEPLVTFNTGAWYSDYGQRIAVWMGDRCLIFRDFDRDIDGMVGLPEVNLAPIYSDPPKLARYVHMEYLHNRYTGLDFEQRLRVGSFKVTDFQYMPL